MPRPKKVKIEVKEEVEKKVIGYIPVDFSNEGLNNLARKLNEIIDYLNAK